MFDAKRAAKQLRAYEKRGATGPTGRLLASICRALDERGVQDFTHLDIGGGVGVLQHELAARGATWTTAVDASAPYLEVLRSAAAARGYAARQERVEGDFTAVADRVQPATVVTLDKVICCYPDMPPLVGAAASKATSWLGVVVPTDRRRGQLGVRCFNWFVRDVRGWAFEAFVHPHSAIDAVCAAQGLTLAEEVPGLFMEVRLYRRVAAGEGVH